MIRDDLEYRSAMKRIDELFFETLEPSEAAEFNRLIQEVEEYEMNMLGSWEDPT